MKSGNINLLEPSGPLQACNETALPFTVLHCQLFDDAVWMQKHPGISWEEYEFTDNRSRVL